MKQHLKLNQVAILCRLVECSTTTIVLQKKGIDFEHEPAALGNENESDENLSTYFQLTDIANGMSSVLKTQVKLVDDFIDARLLRRRSLEYSDATEWEEEIQVSAKINTCM